jgi:hypothetical protein
MSKIKTQNKPKILDQDSPKDSESIEDGEISNSVSSPVKNTTITKNNKKEAPISTQSKTTNNVIEQPTKTSTSIPLIPEAATQPEIETIDTQDPPSEKMNTNPKLDNSVPDKLLPVDSDSQLAQTTVDSGTTTESNQQTTVIVPRVINK